MRKVISYGLKHDLLRAKKHWFKMYVVIGCQSITYTYIKNQCFMKGRTRYGTTVDEMETTK